MRTIVVPSCHCCSLVVSNCHSSLKEALLCPYCNTKVRSERVRDNSIKFNRISQLTHMWYCWSESCLCERSGKERTKGHNEVIISSSIDRSDWVIMAVAETHTPLTHGILLRQLDKTCLVTGYILPLVQIVGQTAAAVAINISSDCNRSESNTGCGAN